MTYLSQGLYTEIRIIRNPQTQEMCWGYNPEALDQEEHIYCRCRKVQDFVGTDIRIPRRALVRGS